MEGATAAFQKAISLNPKLVESHYNLGVALGRQGKTAKAITAFQKAISLNPNHANAHYNLGIALGMQRNLKGTIAAFQKARELYRSQGRTQKANEVTQRLEKLGSR